MLWNQNIAGTPIAQREACSSANNGFHSFSHNMMQYQAIDANNSRLQSKLIKDAATLDIEYQYLADSNAIEIKTVVNNVKAGHKFPTDSPLRHLILVVDVRDEENNLLTLVDGDTIPLWGGVDKIVPGMENYGGMPGRIFANLLRDKDTKASPTAAYWNPTQFAWQTAEETSDTRLDPLKPEEYRYSFTIPSEGKVWINVKLIYRYAFIDLAQQKSWAWSNSQVDNSDIVVVSKSCVVDPMQAELTACIQ